MIKFKFVISLVISMVAGVFSATAAERPDRVLIESTGETKPDSVVCIKVDGSSYGVKNVYGYDDKGRVIRDEEYSRRNYTEWVIEKVTTYVYDDQDRETYCEMLNYDGVSLKSGTRFVTEYDDIEHLVSISEYTKEGDKDWSYETLTIRKYNNFNQPLCITITDTSSGMGYKYLYEYTEDGKEKKLETYRRSDGSAEYLPREKREWTYNGNNCSRVESTWEGRNEDWEYTVRRDYKLNNYGDTLQSTLYLWQWELDDSYDWCSIERYVYNYDDQRRITSWGIWSPGKITWWEQTRYEYQYGQYGIEKYIIRSLNDDGVMEPIYVYVYSYNASGLLDFINYYILNNDLGDLEIFAERRYYYGQSGLAMPAVGTVHVSGLTLELGEALQASVYTIDGRLVHSGWSERISLPAPGLYLVKTHAGCTKVLAR